MHTLSSYILRANLAALVIAAAILAVSAPVVSVSAQEKLKVEDVVAKHLEALGSAEARNKSRIIQGTAVGTFRLGGSGSAEGGAVIASQDVKSLVSIVFESTPPSKPSRTGISCFMKKIDDSQFDVRTSNPKS